MLKYFYKEDKDQTYSQILVKATLSFNSFGVPKISPPTEKEKETLEKLDFTKIQESDMKKLSFRELIHFHESLKFSNKMVLLAMGWASSSIIVTH